jgi:hypothetical protein
MKALEAVDPFVIKRESDRLAVDLFQGESTLFSDL